jgi:hypothetical protein
VGFVANDGTMSHASPVKSGTRSSQGQGCRGELDPQLAFACGVVGRHDMVSQLHLTQYPTGWGPAFCFQGQWHCVSFVRLK